jgi:hypothetical protein
VASENVGFYREAEGILEAGMSVPTGSIKEPEE